MRVGGGSRPGMPLLTRGADMLAAGGEFFERRVELTIALLRKTPLLFQRVCFCLSRACLGNLIVFKMENAPGKGGVRTCCLA